MFPLFLLCLGLSGLATSGPAAAAVPVPAVGPFISRLSTESRLNLVELKPIGKNLFEFVNGDFCDPSAEN